jgi:hypothetical protein
VLSTAAKPGKLYFGVLPAFLPIHRFRATACASGRPQDLPSVMAGWPWCILHQYLSCQGLIFHTVRLNLPSGST